MQILLSLKLYKTALCFMVLCPCGILGVRLEKEYALCSDGIQGEMQQADLVYILHSFAQILVLSQVSLYKADCLWYRFDTRAV